MPKKLSKKMAGTREHTGRVVELCKRFAAELNLSKKDQELLYEAAELHDICKILGKDGCKKLYGTNNHAKASANMAIKWNTTKRPELVASIIEAHYKNFNPKRKVWLLAAILRLSDKLDKFDKGKDDAEDKCNTSWDAVSEWYGENYKNQQRLDDLESAYQTILKEKKKKFPRKKDS